MFFLARDVNTNVNNAAPIPNNLARDENSSPTLQTDQSRNRRAGDSSQRSARMTLVDHLAGVVTPSPQRKTLCASSSLNHRMNLPEKQQANGFPSPSSKVVHLSDDIFPPSNVETGKIRAAECRWVKLWRHRMQFSTHFEAVAAFPSFPREENLLHFVVAVSASFFGLCFFPGNQFWENKNQNFKPESTEAARKKLNICAKEDANVCVWPAFLLWGGRQLDYFACSWVCTIFFCSCLASMIDHAPSLSPALASYYN